MSLFDKIEDKLEQYEKKYDEEDIPPWFGKKQKGKSSDRSNNKSGNTKTDKNTPFDYENNFNIKRNSDADIIELLIPGYPEENIEISVNNNTIVIDIESTENQDKLRYDYDLSDKKYNISEMNAKFKNGLLQIKLPKSS